MPAEDAGAADWGMWCVAREDAGSCVRVGDLRGEVHVLGGDGVDVRRVAFVRRFIPETEDAQSSRPVACPGTVLVPPDRHWSRKLRVNLPD